VLVSFFLTCFTPLLTQNQFTNLIVELASSLSIKKQALKERLKAAEPEEPGSAFGGRLKFRWTPLSRTQELMLAKRGTEKPRTPIVEYQ